MIRASSAPPAPAPPNPAPSARDHALLSYDPMRGEWLVLSFQPSVPGMPVWTVVAAHAERAQAEQMAGLHDAPVRAWLVQDPVLGWRRGANAWVQNVAMAIPCSEADAQVMQRNIPKLRLYVLRADGRVTCPDPAA